MALNHLDGMDSWTETGSNAKIFSQDELERAETLKLDAEYYLGSNWEQDKLGFHCEASMARGSFSVESCLLQFFLIC